MTDASIERLKANLEEERRARSLRELLELFQDSCVQVDDGGSVWLSGRRRNGLLEGLNLTEAHPHWAAEALAWHKAWSN